MAGGAGHVGVAVRQREAGRAVIEFCSQPAVKGMACFAGLGELRRNVIWVGGLLEVGLVARNTGGREPLKLANGCALVAVFTLDRGVRA